MIKQIFKKSMLFWTPTPSFTFYTFTCLLVVYSRLWRRRRKRHRSTEQWTVLSATDTSCAMEYTRPEDTFW